MKNNGTPFYKMTGGGNDFVILDNRKGALRGYEELAKKLCRRKFSVGADGLLVLENSPNADFRMVYYNSDGSRAEMCGNGARCIARFAHILKVVPSKMKFETDAGVLSAEVAGETVKVNMGSPKDLRLDFTLKVEGQKEFNASFLNTGVPHAMVTVSDAEKIDVQQLGKALRFHKEFAPAGTNVNFVQIKDPRNIVVRTYERGVEAETLACGTGVTASAILCGAKGLAHSPVSCLTRGGETLKVYFDIKQDSSGISVKDVELEGPATVCFQGEVEI